MRKFSDEWLDALEERYREPDIPECRVCGGDVECGFVGEGRADYWCRTATRALDHGPWGTERREAREHRAASKVTITRFGDSDVVDLIGVVRRLMEWARQGDDIIPS